MRWFLLLVIAAAGMGGWWWYIHQPDPTPEHLTDKAVATTIVEVVAATGSAEPIETAVVQGELPGVVKSVEAEIGQLVTKDQVLARLHDDLQQTQLKQAKALAATAKAAIELSKSAQSAADAGLKAAEADLALAKSQLERINKVPDAVANKDVETAGAWQSKAQAGIKKAESDIQQALNAMRLAERRQEEADTAIELAEIGLKKTKLTAPITGVIISRGIKLGDTVGRPNISLMDGPTSLFEISAPFNRMRAIVKINEADLSRVRRGQTATFTVDAYPDEIFTATVAEIRPFPAADRTAISYPAVLEFDNRKDPKSNEWMIKPKMTIVADIEVGRATNVIAVPSQAVNFTPTKVLNQPEKLDPDDRFLWQLDDKGVPVARKVKIGVSGPRVGNKRGNGGDVPYIEIKGSDLKEGDSFITGEPAGEKKGKFSLPPL
jgi:HlyD family secretion protein